MAIRRILTALVLSAFVAGSFVGMASSGSAAPGDLTVTLSGNLGDDDSQDSASAVVTCDPSTNLFSVTVSGLVFPSAMWGDIPLGSEPNADDDPYIAFTTPTLRLPIGDIVGGSASASGLSAPDECFVGNLIEVRGPGSDGNAFRVEGTLQESAPPVPPADTTVPVVAQPGNLTVEANRFDGAVVTYPTPTANDPVDGPLPVTCTPPSGTLFGVFTTTVQCRATDPAGNTGSSSFTVTVVDTTAPVISGVPADISVDAPKPTGGSRPATTARVTYTAPTAVDPGRSPVPVTCTPPSGSAFPLGTTQVVCTASDAHGHTTQATFRVTVFSPGGIDVAFTYPTRTDVGGVKGVVGFPDGTAVGAKPSPLSVLSLSPEATVYVCPKEITTLAQAARTSPGREGCTKVTSSDGTGAYAAGSLRPAQYNLFGVRGSAAGELSVGPVSVTIVGGVAKVQNLTLELPKGGAAVAGTATVTRVPTGVTVSEFLDVFACDSSGVQFADGKTRDRTCETGTVTSPPTVGGRALDEYSVSYAVGGPKGSRFLYFAYRSDLGILVSRASAVNATAALTTSNVSIPFPKPNAGGVRGAVRIPTATSDPKPVPSPLAIVTPTNAAEVFACLRTAATTLGQARAEARSGGSSRCRRVESSGRAGAYAVEGVSPGEYNLFAAQQTSAGELVVGPVAVTVVSGRVVVQDLVLAVPRTGGAVAGTVTVTGVPTGVNVTDLAVLACRPDARIDRNGEPTPPNSCVKGSATDPAAVTGRGTITFTSSYQVGVPNTTVRWRLFVVVGSEIGTSTTDVALNVAGGTLTTQNVSVRFSSSAGLGGVRGTLTTAVPIASAASPGAPVVEAAVVFVCDPTVTTVQQAQRQGARAETCIKGAGTLAGGYSVAGVRPGTYNVFAVQTTAVGLLVAGPVSVPVTRGAVATKDLTLVYEKTSGGLFGKATVSRVPAGVQFIEFVGVWACQRTVQFSPNGTPIEDSRTGGQGCVEGTVIGAPIVGQAKTAEVSTSYAVGPMPVPPATWQLYVTFRTDVGVVASGPSAQRVTAGRFGAG